MIEKFQVFDAPHLILEKGINLVEASAGTGKTYAIGMLVLRAIVEKAIPIDEILIVTFTKAATEELKSRIRSRLVEARELLSAADVGAGSQIDETLLSWAATVTEKQTAIKRLQLALYDIDRAAIFTIHGFCQRMLVEQALESNQLFDVELLTNIDPVLSQVVDDYWRNTIYKMDSLPCAIVTRAFPTPENLFATVSLASRTSGSIEPVVEDLASEIEKLISAMESVALWWQSNSTLLREKFIQGIANKHFKKRVYDEFERWFGACGEFFRGASFTVPDNLDLLAVSGLTGELSGTKFRSAAKKVEYLASWNLPDTEVSALLRAIECLLLTFRVNLAAQVRTELSRRLLQQGNMGFDDLIRNLSKGLRGERGVQLTKVLSDRFSVALIDEFQDTDSDQYHIFSTLFGKGNHLLYLIGDPKQAIYKFRGADIHSYFQARKAATTLLTLENNYRSHPYLVNEVNRLFSSREKPFYYDDEILAYNSVHAAKTEEELAFIRGEESQAGMVYCTLPPHLKKKEGRWSSTEAKENFKDYIVAEICNLLNPLKPLLLPGSEGRRLTPKDIAILVRKNSECEEYLHGLAAVGIPAVVGSRKSVYHSNECSEILMLLHSITSPGEVAKLKGALTITWFGFTGDELHNLLEDDEQLSFWQGKMVFYQTLWQEQSFLVMLSHLLEEEEVLVTLAGADFAERAIANILQLLELIQEQETSENLGQSQLLMWLQKMNRDDKPTDNGELLLESDEEAVQIVTMHSAKGLEYPVVFCPVLWSGTDFVSGEKFQVTSHNSDEDIVVDLGSTLFEERKAEAGAEQIAEDLRLLYVALTRAKLRCYTMWADVKKYSPVVDSFDSALGYLLFPDGYCSHEKQREVFCRLSQNSFIEYVEIEAQSEAVSFEQERYEGQLKALATSGRSLHTDWLMSSFSAMVALSDYEYDMKTTGSVAEKAREGREIVVTGLPAGAHFGNVIHDLLEEFSFSNLSDHVDLLSACHTKCKRYGVEAEPENIAELLKNVVQTILPTGFSLSELEENKCLKEMGFYFHLSPLVTDEINEILQADPAVLPLNHKVMRGYLTGFVDLICEYQGKYFIFDYKTNYLGDFTCDYREENLVSAMQAHNYGLQYWIYSLVLHRHLQNLLPGYDYQAHFGGVMYLFVRGMSADMAGNGVYTTLPDYTRLMQLNRLIGGATDE